LFQYRSNNHSWQGMGREEKMGNEEKGNNEILLNVYLNKLQEASNYIRHYSTVRFSLVTFLVTLSFTITGVSLLSLKSVYGILFGWILMAFALLFNWLFDQRTSQMETIGSEYEKNVTEILKKRDIPIDPKEKNLIRPGERGVFGDRISKYVWIGLLIYALLFLLFLIRPSFLKTFFF